VVLLATLSLAILAFTTAQQGDILLIDGKKYSIHTNPLEGFLVKNPERRPHGSVMSSANWRGYIATWEIRDGQLLLKDVEVLVGKDQSSRLEYPGSSYGYRSVLSEVFPERSAIVADWFSGHIIVPTGKLTHYVHMGYASTYDRYLILKVRGGAVLQRWETNEAAFKKFRDSQFAAFKKTPEYQSALTEATSGDDPLNPEDAEEFIREFYSELYMSRLFDEPK